MKEPVSWLFPASSAEPRRPRNSGDRVVFRTCRLTSAEGSDTARLTEKTLSVELLARAAFRQAFHEAHLFALKRELTKTLKLLREDNRRSGALICEAQLRAVTHELLAMGDR